MAFSKSSTHCVDDCSEPDGCLSAPEMYASLGKGAMLGAHLSNRNGTCCCAAAATKGNQMNESIWQRDENWVGSEVEDSFVMVNIESGKYVALNLTANAVWQLLEEPRTQQELEAALQSRFAVDETDCRKSLVTLLEQMREMELAAPR